MHQRKYTFFCLLFICNEVFLILCKQTNCTLSLGGFHGLMLQKKLFRMTIILFLWKKDSKRQTTILLLFLIVSFKEKALQEIGYSEASFNWLCCELYSLAVQKVWRDGGRGGESISCRKFFFFHSNQVKQSWISQWFNSLVHTADICLCRLTYSVNRMELNRIKKTHFWSDKS